MWNKSTQIITCNFVVKAKFNSCKGNLCPPIYLHWLSIYLFWLPLRWTLWTLNGPSDQALISQQTSRVSTKHFGVLSTCTLHRPPGDPENSSLNLTTHYFFCKNDWGLFRRGWGGVAAHSYYVPVHDMHTVCCCCCFIDFFPLFSLSPPLPPSQINPADGPGWPVAGTREAPLPHKGMNGSRQSTFTGETRKHCWAEKVPREAFTVPSSELHIGNM